MSAAFPSAGVVMPDGHQQGAYEGMTLQDYFAAKAMQSILQSCPRGIRPQELHLLAQDAYDVADAMLKARQA